MEAIDSTIHKSYPKLRNTIKQAWDSIDNSRILALVSGDSMTQRCQDVINANGINTKW